VFEVDGRRILIDTPPELRLQLLDAGIDTLDAVCFTHDHADHVAGIDDLRAFTVRGRSLSVYGPEVTIAALQQRFAYIFDSGVVPIPGTSKPNLAASALAAHRTASVADVPVTPIQVDHGGSIVFGYRVGAAAYVTDAKVLATEALDALEGVEVLVLNALFERQHPTHLSIPEAIELASAIGARRTFLTHLTHRHTHRALEERLPAGVSPAYDGLVIPF
jgi:phosphoribosyl 1,2-cyclic phosphate phosphodiesterase